jgi:hypothetical protein
MLPFGVTIPATVPQGSEIPEGLTNNPVYRVGRGYAAHFKFEATKDGLEHSQKITRLQNMGNFCCCPFYTRLQQVRRFLCTVTFRCQSDVLYRSIKNSGAVPLSNVGHSVQLILTCRIANIFSKYEPLPVYGNNTVFMIPRFTFIAPDPATPLQRVCCIVQYFKQQVSQDDVIKSRLQH